MSAGTIDKKAFHKISYGLYVVSTKDDGKDVGCISNTFMQATSQPFRTVVILNKENATTQAIRKAGLYTAVCLAESAPMELIGTFGFHTSRDTDKFAHVARGEDAVGMPFVAEHGVARFSVVVRDQMDAGSHIVFLGEVEETAVMSQDAPMTYAYYHAVKGGKTPAAAASFVPGEDDAHDAPAGADGAKRYGWRCTVCGHIEEVDELPDDFICPVCGATRDQFERIEL